jgi:hypothetical protein
MKILGRFLSVEDPDTFFFMRGFPDLASREPDEGKILRRLEARTGERFVADAGDARIGVIC